MSDENRHDDEDHFSYELSKDVYEGMRPSTDEEVARHKAALAFWDEYRKRKDAERRKRAVEIATNAKQRKIREDQEKKRLLDD